MARSKKLIFKDEGLGDSMASLEFAKKHLEDLKGATVLQAQSKADAPKEWREHNVRFSTPLGQEFWFSGFNVGYRGSGPTTLVKVLKLIGWDINPDVIFINDKLQIARELPPKEDLED